MRSLPRLCVRRIRVVEPVQLAVHSTGTERQRHGVSVGKAPADHHTQRREHVERLFEVQRVFQEMRVGEQPGGEEADIAMAVGLPGTRDESLEVRSLRGNTS